MTPPSFKVPKEGSLGLLALGATGLQAWRNARSGASNQSLPPPKKVGGKKKVLLIGWDAADWKVIKPLMDAGKLPALKKLMDEGISGNISTLDPPLSPMLWTSIGTGMLPDKHGILGFTEPDPNTGSVRPVTSTSRKVRALWNILTQQSYKTHLVGWWPSYPAEPINGVCVSNQYQRAHKPISEPWPVSPGVVSPMNMSQVFKNLRIHPDELTEAHILPFIPDAAKIDQEKDPRIGSFSRMLGDCATIHSAATWIMENLDWDFMGVYYDAIDHFSHGFMRFHPPRLPGTPEDLFEQYQHVVDGGYIFHDMMLERLVNLCDKDTHIILLSDHGFKSDHQRPLSLPDEPAGPALEHRQFGILCMKGPEFKKGEKIYGTSLLDITPTILSLFDLPVGKDMDGVPLVQAFNKPVKIKEIESWEKVEGNFGMHDERFREDPFLAQQGLEQLVELGYVEKVEKDAEKGVRVAEVESQYNLSRVYLTSGRENLAKPILEKLFRDKKELRFGLRLVACYRGLGENKKCLDLLKVIKKKQKKENPTISLLEASLLIDENREKEALELLKEINKKHVLNPDLYVLAGKSFLSLKEYKNAQVSFTEALALDPDRAVAHHGIGLSLLRREYFEEAAEAIIHAVGLVYQFPVAHYHLGECLYHLKEYEQAIQCFQLALYMSPGMTQANRWIERILKENPKLKTAVNSREEINVNEIDKRGDQPTSRNVKPFAGKIRGEVTLVSGLPRSGTSMMMQMLEKGGMEIFSDQKRVADPSNPKGYYEHDAIKNTAQDKRWVKQAVGKSAKVISHLLPMLPKTYKYRIIFMRRDLREIIASQHTMLVRNKKVKADEYPIAVEMAFQKSLQKAEAWAAASPNVEIIYVDYAAIIQHPEKTAADLADFLKTDLNIADMVSVIDKSLYRNKRG